MPSALNASRAVAQYGQPVCCFCGPKKKKKKRGGDEIEREIERERVCVTSVEGVKGERVFFIVFFISISNLLHL